MRLSDVPDYGDPLPPDPPNPTDFQPAQIRFFTLRVGMTNGNVVYGVSPVSITKIDPKEDAKARLKKFIEETPRGSRVGRGKAPFKTQWDLSVCGCQCYVVLDLSNNVKNWQFIGRGLTSKDKADKRTTGVQWVRPADSGNPLPTLETGKIDAACTRIVFSVVSRKDHEPAGSPGCGMNFIIGFVEDDMVMPAIYDPDVPNLGPPFPPHLTDPSPRRE